MQLKRNLEKTSSRFFFTSKDNIFSSNLRTISFWNLFRIQDSLFRSQKLIFKRFFFPKLKVYQCFACFLSKPKNFVKINYLSHFLFPGGTPLQCVVARYMTAQVLCLVSFQFVFNHWWEKEISKAFEVLKELLKIIIRSILYETIK